MRPMAEQNLEPDDIDRIMGIVEPDENEVRALKNEIHRLRMISTQPEGQAPVTGYTKQSPKNVEHVNMIKEAEAYIGVIFHELEKIDGVDKRMLALARTNLQQGFMWWVRAIFQPRSEL